MNNYIYIIKLQIFCLILLLLFLICLFVCLFVYFCRSVGTGRKEGTILFNDTLNTFYLQLYGIIHMVKDHSDSERGNPLPPHRLLFLISSKGSFICTIPQTG